ncbi:TetR/AcrR family transcriptional regulator [Streptomyces sp. NPDC058470]|uniref:TetR/AcrR family transcriptional regulator n=1 Tax=Streptomyces sp. NPDC058470 TaxID=3346515 RepID=UPI003648ECA7
MGRPRGFDEAEVVRSAVELFANRAYDGTSVDDLVAHLGVHRNSLYKTFGSKRGLYLAALRWSLTHDVASVIDRVAEAAGPVRGLREALAVPTTGVGLDLLLLAAVERAPVDTEVAGIVDEAFTALDRAAGASARSDDASGAAALAMGLTAVILGLRMRARSGAASADINQAGDALAQRLGRH